jgi:hypothetical protein
MDIVTTWEWSTTDVVMLVAALSVLAALIMAWWEFYAKPVRDSLRSIERSLSRAPWMRAVPESVRKSA